MSDSLTQCEVDANGPLACHSDALTSVTSSPPPTDPIALPFFFQIERTDAFDASVGLRWQVADTAVLSVNALVPLNRDGLRAGVMPTVAFEYAL